MPQANKMQCTGHNHAVISCHGFWTPFSMSLNKALGAGGGFNKIGGPQSSKLAHIHWSTFAEQQTYTHTPSLGSGQVAQFWEEIAIAFLIISGGAPLTLPTLDQFIAFITKQTSLKQKADTCTHTHTYTHLEIKLVPMHSTNIETFILWALQAHPGTHNEHWSSTALLENYDL